ncbi:MAG: thrombospondin type 3 repeat-containing protein [Myxococcales bacterium]|nr:thrombospondin type 3 repeat-containing protein [Myxococcales bacterium]
MVLGFTGSASSIRSALCAPLLAVLAAVACGDDPGGVIATSVNDTKNPSDGGGDTRRPDGFATLPDSNNPGAGADIDEETDAGPVDGGFGFPCETSADCLSGYCVPSAEGFVCTDFCISDCPAGWECRYASIGGGDPQYICVQRSLNLCRPCTQHDDCVAIDGAFGDRCVSYGKVEGSFCGIECNGPTDCPSGYQCVDVELVGGSGETAFQCVPTSGECQCSQSAISQSAKTTCLTVNELGRCDGERYCSLDGLTSCDAAEAVPEACNGADDDCDGLTDEELTGTQCDLVNQYGTCKGETFCNGGVPSCTGTEASPESCNGLDDNCNDEPDEGFTDTDADGTKDCVDTDDDDDGWLDDVDDCPLVFDPDQLNSDTDKLGDLCDNDDDNDLIPDLVDNCPLVQNPSQVNQDDDKPGDACDTDIDGDEIFNELDNCPTAKNADQADFDGDLEGDMCDGDDDEDNVVDVVDNCTLYPNPDQLDLDNDQIGDACDQDKDGDGKYNAIDNCPLIANPTQSNADGDVIGDLCDDDDDNDGVPDGGDNCPTAFNPGQLNTDAPEDILGDACDPDDDNDDRVDAQDNCPKVKNPLQTDTDSDGQGDACDGDGDGDGVPDDKDNCKDDPNPLQEDSDGDKIGDACDLDDDGDGIPDPGDNCLGLANPLQEDTDLDAIGDACDVDIDGDAILNATDNCPKAPNALQEDADKDGSGDACDGDDDADGIEDSKDNCPGIANPTQDNQDGDSFGDVCDNDDDNDKVADDKDNCPIDQNPLQTDTDVDGDGDACDDDDDGDNDPDVADCGPTDPSVYHGQQEICDGKDNNCVQGADEVGSQGCTTYYLDADQDGSGVASESLCLCPPGKGEYTAKASGDCNDTNPLVNLGAAEICDGIDNNCDLQIDHENSGGCINYYLDKDGDTWGVNDKKCYCKPTGNYRGIWQGGDFDCNDNDPKVSPGAAEVCTGGDENCNGKINEEGAKSCKTYYPDADGDTYGAKVTGKCLCAKTASYAVENNDDCYDGNKYAKPGNGAWYVSQRGDGSFDYDCDGNETRRHTLPGGNCSTILGFCSATQIGFVGSVPACGQSGKFLGGCDSGFFSCDDETSTLQQECH